MVRDVSIEGNHVKVTIALTVAHCPLAKTLQADVEKALKKADEIKSVTVETTAMSKTELNELRTNLQSRAAQTPPGQGNSKAPGPGIDRLGKRELRNIIAIASGKGGVGKSFVTSMLAVQLRRLGYEVGVLDADLTGPSIAKIFGLTERPSKSPSGRITPIKTRTGIRVMSINLIPVRVLMGVMRPLGLFDGRSVRPKIFAMLGPVKSASRTPTSYPSLLSWTASMLVTKDFPTPPLPDAIAIMFLNSRFPSRSMPEPGLFPCAGWVWAALFWSWVRSSFSSVLDIAVVSTATDFTSLDFFRAFSTSVWSVFARGQCATVSAMVTLTWLPSIDTSRTMLRSTILIPISGSSTPRRLLMTEFLSINVYTIRRDFSRLEWGGKVFTLSCHGTTRSLREFGLRYDLVQDCDSSP